MNNTVWQEQCIFAPSLICLDLCNLEAQVKALKGAGVKVLHIDILDGYFSPSMPVGLDLIKQLRKKTDIAFDVHLMVKNHEFYVNELLDMGISQLLFHIEEEPHVDGLLNRISSRGVRAGVALKPATPLGDLTYILDKCDTVMLMLINPGYASSAREQQVGYADRKIRDLRQLINEREQNTLIEIDGRVSADNIIKYGKEAVQIFVTGSTCFSSAGIADDFAKLNNIRTAVLDRQEVRI